MSEPRSITLTLRAWIAVAVVVVLGLLIFAAQLTFIIQQRGIVDDQRKIALRGEDRSAPVLETAGALLGSPQDARAAVDEAGDALQDLRSVLRSVMDEDVVGVTSDALRRAPELLAAVDRTVRILGRTYPTLRASLDTQRSSLDIQRQTLALLRRSLRVQRATEGIAGQTLGVASETRDIAAETRDIARETLRHTESIDTKTGGPLAAGG